MGTPLAILLFAPLLIGQSGPIQGISGLTRNEWSGTRRIDDGHGWVQGDNYMLSLRPGETDLAGTAYFLMTRYSHSPRQGKIPAEERSWMECYKGVYRLHKHPREDDVLLIHLGFTKRYRGTFVADGASATWAAEQTFKPIGAHLLLILDEDRSVPVDELELSVERGFFVDERGDETVVRSEPSTFSEKLIGQGEVRKVRTLPFAEIGETLPFMQGDPFVGGFDAGFRTPPGYRSRTRQTRLTHMQVIQALRPDLVPPDNAP